MYGTDTNDIWLAARNIVANRYPNEVTEEFNKLAYVQRQEDFVKQVVAMAPDKPIQCIKLLRMAFPELGLKECKDLIDAERGIPKNQW